MKIQILQVGGGKGGDFAGPVAEFEKRLNGLCDFEVKVLKGSSGGSSGIPRERVIEEDSRAVMDAIDGIRGRGPESFVVILDEKGGEMESVKFSGLLGKMKDEGRSLVFVIGGAFGLNDEVKKSADKLLAFSKMTFTHQMVKVFLLEQIYRGFCILNGKEYHY